MFLHSLCWSSCIEFLASLRGELWPWSCKDEINIYPHKLVFGPCFITAATEIRLEQWRRFLFFYAWIFSLPPSPGAAVFGTFVKTQVAVAAWIYFWVFCSAASVCVSVFMQVPRCSPFVTVAAWCNLMSGTETPPALLFLLCLALLSQESFVLPREI